MGEDGGQRWLVHLHALRAHELTFAIRNFADLTASPSSLSVLEIGAGTGAQAQELENLGFHVLAIDVAESSYSAARVRPVLEYDGRHIPFPDQRFDAVFSSNVLEHVPHVREFQEEIRRVLKDDGMVVHILPSPAWRFWTTVAYYLHVAGLLWNARAAKSAMERRGSSRAGAARWKILAGAIFPSRHGETGNWFTELWYFSRSHWKHLFQETGWNITRIESTGLFYTGHSILGQLLSLRTRRLMAKALGGATNVFVLRKKTRQSQG